VAVLAVVTVVAVAVIAWSITTIRPVEAREDTRQQVTRVAERFTAEYNDYDATASLEDYQQTLGSLMTTKFRTRFEQSMADIGPAMRESEMRSTGDVLVSGVASLDQDSARVLVAADADVETVFGPRSRHFRWEISLVKVDGEWLVDDYTAVA